MRNLNYKKLLYKFWGGTLLVLVLSCKPGSSGCPDESTIYLTFYKKDTTVNNSYHNYNIKVTDKYIDTVTYKLIAQANGKSIQLYDPENIPADISTDQMSLFFIQKDRSDTLILKYNLQRQNCESYSGKKGLYLEVNSVFLKNTFNESNHTLGCIIGPYYR